jgi:hypothetical protein
MQVGFHRRGSGMPGDAGLNTAANRTSATHLQSFQERLLVWWIAAWHALADLTGKVVSSS